MLGDCGHELTRQRRGVVVALLLGEVTLEHGIGGPLAEIGLEDRCEGEAPARPPAADAVSPRHRRPGP